ncbi:MAG TPA: sigma-54 dependent transcriptional regulator [Bryobacteraceae bacterium]|jgi:DNA-binding NtrC family response regulator|nr:sigma-54 dependent transcriptional regulator [Bryobacteraceae bacterium]
MAEELPTGFVGRALKVVQIRGQIEKLADKRTPVLILGESGTGKEVAARSLYNAAPRGQFVPIDCGSLVGPLMESELFGHTRGAFTGAGEAKKGLIEVANGGTAFFDEIGDLPLDLQVKLLRVLQEREFRPVGSLQRIKVDVRIIAATHRDLSREVASGRFREDLFYRLNVVRLTLPPLRERKDDIPLLIERFLQTPERRYTITHEAMEAMLDYPWPGNIRELKNCIERMMALADGNLLQFLDLPTTVAYHVRARAGVASAAIVHGGSFARPNVLSRPETTPAAAPGFFGAPIMTEGAILPLYEVERRAIQHALVHTKGDRTEAASLLGIGRTTLYRKLKEYQMN